MNDSPWASSGVGPSGSDRSSRTGPGRLIEIVTVLLLGVATVGSAWSAYQVAQWNGIETDEARSSAVFRIDASREYALATQIVAYDSATVAQVAAAAAADDEQLLTFLRETLVRPGFAPILDSWEAQVAAGETPTNLIADEDYLDPLFAASAAAEDEATAATALSEDAGSNADDYIRLTLFFASALFFAGITASFGHRLSRVLLLAAATSVLVLAGVLLAGYPIA